MSTAIASPPACLWVPPGATGTYGDDVAEVAECIGRPLVPAQRAAVDALVSHDKRGRLLTVEAGVELPRQNGKTGAILLPIVLWSILTKPDNFVWTSHLLDSSAKSFHELAGKRPDDEEGLIVSCDWLRRRVRAPSYENAQEGVTFVNGGQLDFRARSGRRGRGPSYSTVVFDEWLFGEAEQAAAVLPALATRSMAGSARALYASSAALKASKHLRRLRARAVAKDPTLTWVAWWSRGSWDDPGCDSDECSHEVGSVGCSLDDESRWVEANPLLEVFTSLAFLRSMRATMSPRQFAREFMGWQEDGEDAADPQVWASLFDKDSTPLPRPVVLVLDVDPGQRSASVLAVGRRADGLVHVEVLASRPGTDWLPPFLLDKQRSTGSAIWHLAGRHPVASVLPALKGLRLRPVPLTEFVAACTHAAKVIEDRGVRHRGDQQLTSAVTRSETAPAGDGSRVLSRKLSEGDVSPAFALFIGLWALPLAASYDLMSSVR